jgi:hypothetical protein
MRLDSISAMSGAAALVGALLLVPALGGADSHEGESKASEGAATETDKAVKDVDQAAKDGEKALEKDVDSMLTKDGKPRPDDPFALKPEGEASQGEK